MPFFTLIKAQYSNARSGSRFGTLVHRNFTESESSSPAVKPSARTDFSVGVRSRIFSSAGPELGCATTDAASGSDRTVEHPAHDNVSSASGKISEKKIREKVEWWAGAAMRRLERNSATKGWQKLYRSPPAHARAVACGAPNGSRWPVVKTTRIIHLGSWRPTKIFHFEHLMNSPDQYHCVNFPCNSGAIHKGHAASEL